MALIAAAAVAASDDPDANDAFASFPSASEFDEPLAAAFASAGAAAADAGHEASASASAAAAAAPLPQPLRALDGADPPSSNAEAEAEAVGDPFISSDPIAVMGVGAQREALLFADAPPPPLARAAAAIEAGDVEALRATFAADEEAVLRWRLPDGKSALQLAAARGELACLRALLECADAATRSGCIGDALTAAAGSPAPHATACVRELCAFARAHRGVLFAPRVGDDAFDERRKQMRAVLINALEAAAAAAAGGREAAVRELLAALADASASQLAAADLARPLAAAARRDDVALVSLLLDALWPNTHARGAASRFEAREAVFSDGLNAVAMEAARAGAVASLALLRARRPDAVAHVSALVKAAAGGGQRRVLAMLLQPEYAAAWDVGCLVSVSELGDAPTLALALQAVGKRLGEAARAAAAPQAFSFRSCEGVVTAAARNGHAECVRVALEFDASWVFPSALLLAAEGGHAACVRLLLACEGARARFNAATINRALVAAARRGAASCVEQLLAQPGAQPNCVLTIGISSVTTPLQAAVLSGQRRVAQLLLAHGADGSGATAAASVRVLRARNAFSPRLTLLPLEAAAAQGDAEMVALLLEAGADALACTEASGLTIDEQKRVHLPSERAASWGHLEAMRLLIRAERRARNTSSAAPHENACVVWAALSGSEECVAAALEEGASARVRAAVGGVREVTAAYAAVCSGSAACLMRVLAAPGCVEGLEVKPMGSVFAASSAETGRFKGAMRANCTPLSVAASEGREDLVGLLLDAGALPRVHRSFTFGQSPLTLAVQKELARSSLLAALRCSLAAARAADADTPLAAFVQSAKYDPCVWRVVSRFATPAPTMTARVWPPEEEKERVQEGGGFDLFG